MHGETVKKGIFRWRYFTGSEPIRNFLNRNDNKIPSLTSGDLHWWSSLPVGAINGVWQYRKVSVAVFLCGRWKQRISGVCLFVCACVKAESERMSCYMTLNVKYFEDCWLKEDHLITCVAMNSPLGYKRSNEYSTWLQA